jgi:hypothetical protein
MTNFITYKKVKAETEKGERIEGVLVDVIPQGTMWEVIVNLPNKGLKSFHGDWRPTRDAIEALGLKKGDPVIINYKQAWDWSITTPGFEAEG